MSLSTIMNKMEELERESYASPPLCIVTTDPPPRAFGSLRFVFLTAPMREVSCYGDPKPEHHAWHDYWTDHGGDEGRPDIEEEIDSGQLDWTRQQVHAIMDAEAALRCFLHLTPYFLLLTSCVLLLTSYLLPLTSYFLLLTSCFLLLTSYFLRLTSYFLRLTS